MADAAGFDFTLTEPNPNSKNITDAMWWLWLQLKKLEPKDTVLGGIYARKSGYHNTRKDNLETFSDPKTGYYDYSVRDPIDREGPDDKAAAIDWTFLPAQKGNYKKIAKYFKRFMDAARARDPRLVGWREGYGQGDDDPEVEGWDIRYHRAVTSDSSHLWHLHFSETRKYVESFWNKACLLSVLSGETLEQYRVRGGKLVSEDPLFTSEEKGEAVEPKEFWKFRGKDYINENPTTKNNQLARTHQYSRQARDELRAFRVDVEDRLSQIECQLKAVLVASGGDGASRIVEVLERQEEEAREYRAEVLARLGRLETMIDTVDDLIEQLDPVEAVDRIRDLFGRYRLTLVEGEEEA